MKPIITIALSLLLAVPGICQDAQHIYKKTVNSTVTIETSLSTGSGFFVAPNIIATNYHVIENASSAVCYLNNSNRTYEIEGYLAVDKAVDLVLLEVSGIKREPIPISSESVSPGQQIYVIGSPIGLEATISNGIVSGMRDFDGHKLIQMTAPISPGSSGGPVLNADGELIGVSVSQYADGQNLNFAIPKHELELLIQFMNSYPSDLAELSVGAAGSAGSGGSLGGGNDYSEDYSNGRGNDGGSLGGSDNPQDHYSNRNNGGYDNSTDDNGYSLDSEILAANYVSDQAPELRLDYYAGFEDVSCFFFTYDMSDNEDQYNSIYLENYRLVDNATGRVYESISTDMPSVDDPRFVYNGTWTRFLVCFDRLPRSVRRFSLMEDDCGEGYFCFENINFDLMRNAKDDDIDWDLYDDNKNSGTVSFFTKQNIGHIKVTVEGYEMGTLTRYFSNPDYNPSCGDTGDAMITLRLMEGVYNYKAESEDLIWEGTFEVEREGCEKISFIK